MVDGSAGKTAEAAWLDATLPLARRALDLVGRAQAEAPPADITPGSNMCSEHPADQLPNPPHSQRTASSVRSRCMREC